MVDPQWRWSPDEEAWFSDTLNMVVFRDNEALSITNWSMWIRWFHTNTGIGNSLNMWWPSRPGDHSAWVLCDRCGLPFEIPTGFTMSALEGRKGAIDFLNDVTWTGGPCTRCKAEDGVIATGEPLLTTVMDGHGRATIAGSQATALMAASWWDEVTHGLGTGSVSVGDAAGRLRSIGGPLTRLADWLETRPVSTGAACAIMAAIAALVGPQLAALDTDSVNEKQISEIINTVLDHYDSVHSQPPPADGQQKARPPKRK